MKLYEYQAKEVFKEEALLKSSHLELPFALSLYNEAVKEEHIDKKVLEALWAFSSKT